MPPKESDVRSMHPAVAANFPTSFPFRLFLFILNPSLPKDGHKITIQEQTLEDFRTPDKTAHRFLKVEHDYVIERITCSLRHKSVGRFYD